MTLATVLLLVLAVVLGIFGASRVEAGDPVIGVIAIVVAVALVIWAL